MAVFLVLHWYIIKKNQLVEKREWHNEVKYLSTYFEYDKDGCFSKITWFLDTDESGYITDTYKNEGKKNSSRHIIDTYLDRANFFEYEYEGSGDGFSDYWYCWYENTGENIEMNVSNEYTPDLIKAENICLSFLMEDNYVECKISYKNAENADYWFFKIDKENNLSDISHETNLWVYIDHTAVGTYKFQEDTGIETLEIYFSFYGSRDRYVVSWRAE